MSEKKSFYQIQHEKFLSETLLPIIISSGFCTIQELNYLHIVLKKKFNFLNYFLYTTPKPNGIEKFNFWKLGFKRFSLRPISHIVRNNQDITSQTNIDFYTKNLIITDKVTNNPTPIQLIDIFSSTQEQLNEFYLHFLNQVKNLNITKLSSGLQGEILRDVIRTYQSYKFFREGELGCKMLSNILLSISQAMPSVGYCQGMNFVSGTLLLGCLPFNISDYDNDDIKNEDETSSINKYINQLDENLDRDIKQIINDKTFTHILSEEKQLEIEAQVFRLLLELIKPNSFSMNGLWSDKIPKLKLRVYQLDRLLRWYLPKLHQHFIKIDISPEVITAQWFITLFSYNLSPKITLELWDYIFFTGWEGIFRIAVALLSLMETKLLELEDMSGLGNIIRGWKNDNIFTIKEIFNVAKDLIITEEVLIRLQESYALEILSLAYQKCIEVEEKYLQEKFNNSNSNSLSSSLTDNTANYLLNLATQSFSSFTIGSPISKRKELFDNIPSETSSILSPNTPSTSPLENLNDEKLKLQREEHELIESTILILNRIRNKKLRFISDQPTFWLHRYRQKLSLKTSLELLELQEELSILEDEVDQDKSVIQTKLLKVCEASRLAEEDVQYWNEKQVTYQSMYNQVQIDFNTALYEAERISKEAASLLSQMELKKNNMSNEVSSSEPSTSSKKRIKDVVVAHKISSVKKIQNKLLNVLRKSTSPSSSDSSSMDDAIELKNIDIGKNSPVESCNNSSVSNLNVCLNQLNEDCFCNSDENSDESDSSSEKLNTLNVNKINFTSINSSITPNSSTTPSLSVMTETYKLLELSSQQAQQNLIQLAKTLETHKKNLEIADKNLLQSHEKEEEMNQWRKSLCDQLQLLVEDSNRGRSLKLLYISETYIV